MSYVLVAGLAVAALLAGAGIGYWFGRAGKAVESAKLTEVEDEFSTYREKVTDHFAETASHFQSLGQQYRELYEHMAAGSQALCNSEDAAPKLPFGAAGAAAIAAGTAGVATEDHSEAEAPKEYRSKEKPAESIDVSQDEPSADEVATPTVHSEASTEHQSNQPTTPDGGEVTAEDAVPSDAPGGVLTDEPVAATAEETPADKPAERDAKSAERTIH